MKALAAPLVHREFRLLWLAQLGSDLGDWIGRVALSILIFERTGSAFTTALVTTVSVLPYVGLGPFLTARLSRFHRRSVLVGSDLGRAVLFALLAVSLPIPVLLVITFLAGCLSPPFEAVRSAAVPTTVPPEDFGDANALMTLTLEAALLLGYAAGGGLVAIVGVRPALLVNAASFLLSALLLTRLHLPGEDARRAHEQVTVRSGVRAVLNDPFVRRFVWTYSIAGGCALIPEALGPVLVEGELGRGPALVGLLAAAVPLSVIFTTIIVPRRGTDTVLLRSAATMSLIGCGTAAAVFAFKPDLPFIFLPFLAVGVTFTSRIPGTQVVGVRLDDHLRANAYAVISACIAAGQAVVPLGAGLLARSIGVRHAAAWCLLGAALISAYAAIFPPRRAPSHAVPVGVRTPR
jgi:predicted MFS family arabinose efflux permease